MKLVNVVKEFTKQDEVKAYKPDIKLAMILSHDTDNSIGVFPYSSEGTPIQVVEYLAQGFLTECEVLLMYQALKEIKNNNSKLYDECIKVLTERKYERLDEVLIRLEPVNNKEVS